MSRELYIVQYEGVGEHDYHPTRYWGPFRDMMGVLCYLYDGSRSPFVGHPGFLDWFDDNVTRLVCGPEDGSIAWLTDILGVSIETEVPAGDVMRMMLKPAGPRLAAMLGEADPRPLTRREPHQFMPMREPKEKQCLICRPMIAGADHEIHQVPVPPGE